MKIKFYSISLMMAIILTTVVLSCGPDAITYDYDAVCDGVGNTGTYKIKIYTVGRNTEKAKEKSRTHAVHAVLFKGVSGADNCQSQKPICNASYSENRGWFDNFFNSGDYLKYVSYANGGYVDAKDLVKMPNGDYKAGVSVIIRVDDLRKKMEKEGFARSLSQGF